MKRIKLTGEETDAFSRWRGIQNWKRGELKNIKRRYNRRLRQISKQNVRKKIKRFEEFKLLVPKVV